MSKDVNLTLRLEEEIWGNRLYDEQSGMVTLLEFLTNCYLYSFKEIEENNNSRSLNQKNSNSHIVLRALVFSNPFLEICDSWEKWEHRFKEQFKNNQIFPANWSSEYLQKAFGSDQDGYRAFVSTIYLIRMSALNADGEKKWDGKFVFPWGKNCLFSDFDYPASVKAGTLTRKRHYFAHNGDMVYLLLSYSAKRDEAISLIREKFLDSSHIMERVCNVLDSADQYNVPLHLVSNGMLPSEKSSRKIVSKRADLLCEDLISLMRLDIQSTDLVNPMARIIGLHLMCYQFERISDLKEEFDFGFLCEVLKVPTCSVRKVSQANFQRNSKVSLSVLGEQLSQRIALAKLECDDFKSKQARFKANIPLTNYKDTDSLLEAEEIELLTQTLFDKLESKHKKHLGKFHLGMGRSIGLISKEKTRGYRYLPDDHLIQAIVMASVSSKFIDVKDFLREIFQKYHLIFAEEEFNDSSLSKFHSPEKSELEKNRTRLLNQLQSLGMLKHLSDGCDFVVNPFVSE